MACKSALPVAVGFVKRSASFTVKDLIPEARHSASSVPASISSKRWLFTREDRDEARRAAEHGVKARKSEGATAPGKWWMPDPQSGVWVPESKFGEGESKVGEGEKRLSISNKGRLDKRAWWTSFEEIPDRHYA